MGTEVNAQITGTIIREQGEGPTDGSAPHRYTVTFK